MLARLHPSPLQVSPASDRWATLQATWDDATQGDTKAIHTALKVLGAIRRSHGLDDADISVSVKVRPVEEQLMHFSDEALYELLAALREAGEGEEPAVG